MKYENILTSVQDAVALVTLNRPKVLNALNHDMMAELADAVDGFETDDAIGAIVLTGNDKAFAAGADISEMVEKTFIDMYMSDHFAPHWERVSKCRKPMIAAVSGHALGGGCELAMMCDVIVCADNARFGQPEVSLGLLPGFGATTRLVRRVGLAWAKQLVLCGEPIAVDEALRIGLVNRVFEPDELVAAAVAAGQTIASRGPLAVAAAKRVMQQGQDADARVAQALEQQAFGLSFATADRVEGIEAFLAKRDPKFEAR